MKYKIYVNEEQLEKIKDIVPNIEFQMLYNSQPRSARSIEWRKVNEKRYKEYQKKYRLKKKMGKKNEQQSTKTKSKARRLGIRRKQDNNKKHIHKKLDELKCI